MALTRRRESREAVARSSALRWRRPRPSPAHGRSTTPRGGNRTHPVGPSGRRPLSTRHGPGDGVARHGWRAG
jgi:hypothetical protein